MGKQQARPPCFIVRAGSPAGWKIHVSASSIQLSRVKLDLTSLHFASGDSFTLK